MSMHNTPLTPTEEAGLRAHGLPIGQPSQLADAFRAGMAYADRAKREPVPVVHAQGCPALGGYGHGVGPCECAALPVQQARVPDFWAVVEPSGFVSYTAPNPEACHEHINDAINEFGINEAAQWQVRSAYFDAAPTPPMTQEQARGPEAVAVGSEDTARINAIERLGLSLRCQWKNTGWAGGPKFSCGQYAALPFAYAESARAAIDAAIAAAPQPPGEAE